MEEKKELMMNKYPHKLFYIFIILILSGTFFWDILSSYKPREILIVTDDSQNSKTIRLMSSAPLTQNKIHNLTQPEINPPLVNNEDDIIPVQGLNVPNNTTFLHPTFKITSSNDVAIDKINPEAMEINASSMTFLLNFTIVGAIGQGSTAFEKLTLNNTVENYQIATWSDWQFSPFNDHYSLIFTLNNSFFSSLSLGNYDLTLFTNILGHRSNDSIPLPMKDLQITINSISPPQFNNKLDEDQRFNITITIQEYDGVNTQKINKLPPILDKDSRNINPNVTIISATQEESAPLHFVRFISNSTSEGRYTFEVNLTRDDAPYFEDGMHTLAISVTTYEWIRANDTKYNYFQAKGTIYIVRLKEITVGSNNPLDYNELTNNGKDHKEFRVNINESIIVRYEVVDNSTNNPPNPLSLIAGQLIGYQDPNRPDDPFALNTSTIPASGNGTILLTANVLTSSDGYSLLFFVRGHRTSQLTWGFSNITIFWDILYYEYTYYDNLGDVGTGNWENPNYIQRALGIDINAWWAFQLGVYYASDDSPALSSQISYHFSNESWQDLTDGEDNDSLDGTFLINRTESKATVLNLSIQIINGSIIDPQGTLFVDKTLGEANITIPIIWTYLIIEMTPQESDRRLGTNRRTTINLTAYWAHNTILSFNGTLNVMYPPPIGSEMGLIIGLTLIDGQVNWTQGIVQTNTGIYTYKVSGINPKLNIFGVETFKNSTDGLEVQTKIIWEEIYFSFSQDGLSFHDDLEFFANFNENATLYCYGNHTFDGEPFKGEAFLLDFDRADEYPLIFNASGIAIWEGDLTEVRFPVSFSIYEITYSSEIDWEVYKIGRKTYVVISWDKILVTLSADQSYSHGTIARIDIDFEYLVYIDKDVNDTAIEFDLLLSNGSTLHFSGGNNTYFFDYSHKPDVRWYNVSDLYDASTGITGFEARYKWNDILDMTTPQSDKNMTICWIDDKNPSILEYSWYDFGNGTIIIIVDVTDNSEDWFGSGIRSVALIDKREDINQRFSDSGGIKYYQFISGVYRYVFIYRYNQETAQGLFKFEFNETLEFQLSVTDNGTVETFPQWLGSKRDPHTVTTKTFSIHVDYDPDKPLFIRKDGYFITISYKTISTVELSNDIKNITDGSIIVIVAAFDSWAGLDDYSIQLIVTDISNRTILYVVTMDRINNPEDSHSEFQFEWEGILSVSRAYSFKVTVIDNAGNTNSWTRITEIEDHVAPRVKYVSFTPTSDRKLNIMVTIEEKGLGINYIEGGIKYGEKILKWVNLTYQGGGRGGQQASGSELRNYSALVTLDFDLYEIFFIKNYFLVLNVSDNAGNLKHYSSDELINIWDLTIDVALDPLMLHPFFLISAGLCLLIGIIIGVRITSKTVGYDIQHILVESDRVSREIVLTMMDEYALGITVNFFDQVQGPVPVIWEPPLLEDQQQIMLDLSDKSFSTLEFVGSEEDERSGIFDFSTGSYDCIALGYSFAIANPAARGGKENLSIVLLLRKEWGDNLLFFQDILLEKIREIRKLIEAQEASSLISKKGRELREFVSRLMIAFNKLYSDIDHKVESKVVMKNA